MEVLRSTRIKRSFPFQLDPNTHKRHVSYTKVVRPGVRMLRFYKGHSTNEVRKAWTELFPRQDK